MKQNRSRSWKLWIAFSVVLLVPVSIYIVAYQAGIVVDQQVDYGKVSQIHHDKTRVAVIDLSDGTQTRLTVPGHVQTGDEVPVIIHHRLNNKKDYLLDEAGLLHLD